jgi:hypothetical protein
MSSLSIAAPSVSSRLSAWARGPRPRATEAVAGRARDQPFVHLVRYPRRPARSRRRRRSPLPDADLQLVAGALIGTPVSRVTRPFRAFVRQRSREQLERIFGALTFGGGPARSS